MVYEVVEDGGDNGNGTIKKILDDTNKKKNVYNSSCPPPLPRPFLRLVVAVVVVFVCVVRRLHYPMGTAWLL